MAEEAATACLREAESCSEGTQGAQTLRIASVFIILACSGLGVALPMLAGRWGRLREHQSAFMLIKAFAAGVILATGFVHMFPTAHDALSSECLGWPEYPWAGMIAAATAIIVQAVEFGISLWSERRLERQAGLTHREGDSSLASLNGNAAASRTNGSEAGLCTGHRHLHPHMEAQDPHDLLAKKTDEEAGASSGAVLHGSSVLTTAELHAHDHHESAHGHGPRSADLARHVAIAQVLEMGIALHSVLIGIALGTAQSVCTMRPLLAALSFHQFFEGLALGGCLTQANFKACSYALMAGLFAVTTPVGVVIGIIIQSSYNANSPSALGVSGVFDSISAGILIYMALVDLIAVDFQSKQLRMNPKLQAAAFVALALGVALMSLLAIWA